MTTLCRMFCAAELDQALETLREHRGLNKDDEQATAGAKESGSEEEGVEEEGEEEEEEEV